MTYDSWIVRFDFFQWTLNAVKLYSFKVISLWIMASSSLGWHFQKICLNVSTLLLFAHTLSSSVSESNVDTYNCVNIMLFIVKHLSLLILSEIIWNWKGRKDVFHRDFLYCFHWHWKEGDRIIIVLLFSCHAGIKYSMHDWRMLAYAVPISVARTCCFGWHTRVDTNTGVGYVRFIGHGCG